MARVDYTPGQWQMESGGMNKIRIVAPNSDNRVIAVIESGRKLPTVEDCANAQLIATSPWLLEAADNVVKCWETGDLAGAVRHLSEVADIAKGMSGL